MQKTTLVIGATGTLGESVTRHLKEDAFLVRVLTRDSSKAHKLFNETFEIIVGDVTDIQSLQKSMEGCFGVHINLAPPEIEGLGVENVVSAGLQKGIKRITYVSADNVSEEYVKWFPPFKHKIDTEKTIRESGIPYSIFCPTSSMEALPMFVMGGKIAVLGKQPNPYHWFAANDLIIRNRRSCGSGSC